MARANVGTVRKCYCRYQPAQPDSFRSKALQLWTMHVTSTIYSLWNKCITFISTQRTCNEIVILSTGKIDVIFLSSALPHGVIFASTIAVFPGNAWCHLRIHCWNLLQVAFWGNVEDNACCWATIYIYIVEICYKLRFEGNVEEKLCSWELLKVCCLLNAVMIRVQRKKFSCIETAGKWVVGLPWCPGR